MGGPGSLDEVESFLTNLFTDTDIMTLPFQSKSGRWIAKRRTPSIRRKYEEIGGKSPILNWTKKQGDALVRLLDAQSLSSAPHKYYVAFRYAQPLMADAFEQVERDGIETLVAFSQYPQFSCSTSGSSFNELAQFYAKRPQSIISRWKLIDRWPTHPLLIETFVDRIRSKLKEFPSEVQSKVVILFSAHSLPLKVVNRGDQYPYEIGATVQAVMSQLNFSNPYRLTWQSKVGPVPWLQPSTESAIKGYVERGRKDFLLVPIAFVNEHIETLHEMDIEYAQDFAKKVGASSVLRASAPNDHPLFVQCLADVVKNALDLKQPCSNQFLLSCPQCVNPRCREMRRWVRGLR